MIVDSVIRVGFDELSESELRKLFRALTFQNDNQEVVQCYKPILTRELVKIPRGAWYLDPLDRLDYRDRRVKPELKRMKFKLKLDDVERDERFAGQTEALEAMKLHEQGLIIRPPGTGKTQIALAFIAQCETPSLVLVHTEDILRQWIEYAENAIPELQGRVGVIGSGTFSIGPVTIATVQTIRRYIDDKEFWRQFGCLIVDEAHHAAAATWESILNVSPAFYRFGFTASPTRADGMHPAMRFLIGSVIHRQAFSSPVKLTVKPIKTKFKFAYRGPYDWTRMVDKLISDDERNKQIARIADREIRAGNSVLVLSRRIDHLGAIADHMRESGEILTGKRSKPDRKRILREFRDGGIRCLLSTQLADEALDVPILNRVILTHPGKHEGRLIQQVGRALRRHPDKTDAIIYDLIDPRVGPLRRQWDKRKAAYKKSRISIAKRRLKYGAH